MMSTIQVEEYLAEDVEGYFSVSFGFESEISKDDVLFIVCGKERESEAHLPYQNGLYFERFDQVYSGYNFAESILVRSHSIEVDFTLGGYTGLQFPTKQMSFDFSSAKGDYSTIRDTFEKISELEWINVISFDY